MLEAMLPIAHLAISTHRAGDEGPALRSRPLTLASFSSRCAVNARAGGCSSKAVIRGLGVPELVVTVRVDDALRRYRVRYVQHNALTSDFFGLPGVFKHNAQNLWTPTHSEGPF